MNLKRPSLQKVSTYAVKSMGHGQTLDDGFLLYFYWTVITQGCKANWSTVAKVFAHVNAAQAQVLYEASNKIS
jgi:peroxiredoxin